MPRRKTVPRHADGTPERLGRYRLVRPLSTGGMANVFEGRRDAIAGVSPRVAIKVILPDYASDEGFQQLFINEARVGSLLHHQNVVQIQDFDFSDGRYYLVMEYVDGITLRRVVNLCRRHGIVIPLGVIAEIGRQICDGLHYAHSARAEDGSALGLVHRDIKPSNLMVNPQGVVKLLDFGISRALISTDDDAVRGTWGYMGPEQTDGVSNIGPQADLFGLAAVLYELAALEPLFPEKEPDDIKRLLTADEAARRAATIAGHHGSLAPVLVRALQRDPAARFTSAAAMGRSLSTLLPDPVTAREQLVMFQDQMAALAQPGAQVPHRGPNRRSSSTFSSARSQGLPVVAGNRSHPYRGSTKGPGTAQVEERWWIQIIVVVVVSIGLGILAFSGFRVLTDMLRNPDKDESALVEPSRSAADLLPDEQQVPATPPESPEERPEPAQTSTPRPAAPAPTPAPAEPAAPRIEPPEPEVDAEITPVADAKSAAGEEAEGSPPPASSGMGLVTISSIPRARVLVDGKFVRYTPLFRREIPAGAHNITLETDDGRSKRFQLDVVADSEVRRVWSFDDQQFVGK